MNETGYPGGPTRPEARLLALRCLGLPQVAPRTPMSRRRVLRYRLAACFVRLKPGTTAELASLVLRMSDEIDTRERMLDAVLGSAGSGPDGMLIQRPRPAADNPRRAGSVNRLAS